jgi:hypothetical protein
VVGSAEDVYRVKDSAFFNRYIENAVKHTREAEIAGGPRKRPGDGAARQSGVGAGQASPTRWECTWSE